MIWVALIYDLCSSFFLLFRKTRLLVFMLVVVFHILTMILFPIGMFSYIMIFSALIFFSPKFHNRIINYFTNCFSKSSFVIRTSLILDLLALELPHNFTFPNNFNQGSLLFPLFRGIYIIFKKWGYF